MGSTSRHAHQLRVLPLRSVACGEIDDDAALAHTERTEIAERVAPGVSLAWSLIVSVETALALVLALLVFDLLSGNLASVATGEVALWQHVEFRSAMVVGALAATLLVARDRVEA